MKNFYRILFLALLISCSKKQKNEEIPLENLINKDANLVIEEKVVVDFNKLIFTVQIAALENPNDDLENLANVKTYEENYLIKYRFGAFKTYNEAKANKLYLSNDYKGAFIQALKNDRPISIKKALQLSF